MPKKWLGENSKAAKARSQKQAMKDAANEKRKKELEDTYWKDDDKHVIKKLQKKEEKEKKKQEQSEKKELVKNLLQDEEIATHGKSSIQKLTQYEIQQTKQMQPKRDIKPNFVLKPLEENLNRLQIGTEVARTVDEAISILSDESKLDHHPEKRMKAAFLTFEENNLPKLKIENPTMRLSQLKQLLKKKWQKSPENPLNQMHAAYNAKSI